MVPVLYFEGHALSGSKVIARYLAEKFGKNYMYLIFNITMYIMYIKAAKKAISKIFEIGCHGNVLYM